MAVDFKHLLDLSAVSKRMTRECFIKVVPILFFATNIWSMTGLLKVLALLLLLFTCTGSWAHSVGRCKRACTYITYFNYDIVCKECAENPPIDYNMCDFACGNSRVNKHNYEYLDCICEKCFKKGNLMRTMCVINCSFDPKVRYYRLCKGCENYGYYLMDF